MSGGALRGCAAGGGALCGISGSISGGGIGEVLFRAFATAQFSVRSAMAQKLRSMPRGLLLAPFRPHLATRKGAGEGDQSSQHRPLKPESRSGKVLRSET